jgi:hypothetical protein
MIVEVASDGDDIVPPEAIVCLPRDGRNVAARGQDGTGWEGVDQDGAQASSGATKAC